MRVSPLMVEKLLLALTLLSFLLCGVNWILLHWGSCCWVYWIFSLVNFINGLWVNKLTGIIHWIIYWSRINWIWKGVWFSNRKGRCGLSIFTWNRARVSWLYRCFWNYTRKTRSLMKGYKTDGSRSGTLNMFLLLRMQLVVISQLVMGKQKV